MNLFSTPSFRRGRAIRIKEWAQIWLDPSTIGLVVLLPLILMFFFGSAMSLDTYATRTGIVDLDRSAASREVVASFANNEHFTIREETALPPIHDAILRGELRGVVIIPDGFERGLQTGDIRNLHLITDGTQPNTARFLAGHSSGILATWLQARSAEQGQVGSAPPIEVLTRYSYNPELKSRFMLIPGAIAIVLAMIGCLLTALIMAREYERGTMEGLLSTPITIPSLVFNKLAPYYLLGLAAAGLCVGVAVYIYELPLRGSIFALFAIASSFLFAVLGQGLFISAITKSQFVSTQIALLVGFLPSMLLSGFLFEIDSMPKVIQWLTYLVPARYLVGPLQSVFLVGDIWDVFLPNIALLCGLGAFFFLRVTKSITRKIV